MLCQRMLFALAMLPIVIWAVPLQGAAIDSTLYTQYNLGTDPNDIYVIVCGTLPDSIGCYGSATIGPFGRVGSIIEGSPAENVKKGTVTRYVYVVDVASGSSEDGVELYVYKKVDTITSTSDNFTVTLYKTVNLTLLTGGSTATAFLAANSKFLIIGTNENGNAVRVTKSNLDVTHSQKLPKSLLQSPPMIMASSV